MGDISDHRPDHMLMEFEPDADLAARIRERLPDRKKAPRPGETDTERAIRETEEALRADLGE